MYNCIIIIGATATGKTGLSVELAKKLNGEIINADSTQVYKDLNIGTAKATKEEMQGVPHHLMSFLNPDESFNVTQFKEKALEIAEKLISNKKVPIIVGGTGFYVESLLNNYFYGNSLKNEEIRKKYTKLVEDFGNEYVFNILKQVDPKIAEKLHPNDVYRVIRALEIYESTGKTKSQILNENQKTNSTMQSSLKPLIIGLEMDREVLYERINRRFDLMIQAGLKEEVKALYDKGYSANLQSIKSIGYKEYYNYFDGIMTEKEVEEKIKQNSRNYAKRQITWFKRMRNVVWFNMTNQNINDVVNEIINLYNKK